jgi:hypothetical protein
MQRIAKSLYGIVFRSYLRFISPIFSSLNLYLAHFFCELTSSIHRLFVFKIFPFALTQFLNELLLILIRRALIKTFFLIWLSVLHFHIIILCLGVFLTTLLSLKRLIIYISNGTKLIFIISAFLHNIFTCLTIIN